jgi:hypothetical protein
MLVVLLVGLGFEKQLYPLVPPTPISTSTTISF